MEEFAAKILQQGGLNVFLAGLLVLAVGVISGFGPCNLSTIPILISYVAGESDYSRGRGFALSLTFALGSAVTLTLLGVVVATIGGLFGWARQFLYYVAAFICLVMGLKMLGVITASLLPARIFFRRLPLRQGMGGVFLLGMAAGVAGSQCGTPVLLAILSLVVAQDKPLLGAVLLFLYGLGRGVPVVAAGTFTGFFTARSHLLAKGNWQEKIAGTILVAAGLYLAWLA